MSGPRPRSLSLLLLVAVLAVYLLSPVRQISDSRYSLLVSESLIDEQTLTLDRYLPESAEGELPYQLIEADGRTLYRYALGSSLLSIPAVLLLRLAGYSTVGPDGLYDFASEYRMQKRLAPLLVAVTVLLIFRAARLLLPPGWALTVAAAFALGSQLWSTASRGLWSHTWSVLLLTWVAYELLAAARGRKKLSGVLVGTLLAWAFFCRPTAAMPLAAVPVYALLTAPRRGLAMGATLALWLAGFVLFSWTQFGSLLPVYFNPGLYFQGEPIAPVLAANLVSPSRGLLVFLPHLLFVGYLLARYRAALRPRGPVLLSLAIVALHLLVISAASYWWAGHAYGARLSTDIVPWLAVLSICAVAAWLASARPGTRALRLERAVAALLLAAAMGLNSVGALSREADQCWNAYPVDVNDDPSRVWSWRDPQFLAWLRPRCEAADPSR